MTPAGWVLVGKVLGAHGIKGEVKLMAWTEDPMTLAKLGPLRQGPDGPVLGVVALRPAKAGLIGRLAGISDRNQAEALRGAMLYAPRDKLGSPQDDEVMAVDLIGLLVEGPDGASLGRVTAVVNYGASDILEIEDAGGHKAMIPFIRHAVTMVDIANGVLRADPDFLA